ncbi:MAG: hypothetical protein WC548_03155 [Candidatus Pacearchaeota archaeon]
MNLRKSVGGPIRRLRKNYWIVSTFVLAIIIVGMLIFGLVNFGGINANVVGQKVVEFANSQGANAELVSVEEDGELFKVILSIDSQEFPVYVTRDGKNLVPSLIPLETTITSDTQQQTSTDIPKNDKPIIEAFVMSHCPYGTQIEKGLIPVANLLKDKIDFKIKFVYYAMHPSQGEVQEQLNQYCIQEEQNDKYIDYLTCFLDKGDGTSCITSTGIDKTKLAACVEKTDKEFAVTENLNDKTKWLSGNYPLFNIYKEDNERYGVGGSPTLIINGVEAQSGRDSASLLSTICSAFNVAPEECNTQLSSAQPSPGFGFSTTSNTNNAAQCG